MEYKSEGNENKTVLGDFNCIMDKINKDWGNKTRRHYRWGSNYALSKLIMDNGLKHLCRRENQIPLSSPTTIDPLAQDPG